MRHDPKDVKKWIQEAMEVTTAGEPGLLIPVKVKAGFDWKNMKKIE